jgi:hypothetical protein
MTVSSKLAVAGEDDPNWFLYSNQTMHTIPPLSYLTRNESRASQGCHNDHGDNIEEDNNLDGARGVCHRVCCVVVAVVAVLVI